MQRAMFNALRVPSNNGCWLLVSTFDQGDNLFVHAAAFSTSGPSCLVSIGSDASAWLDGETGAHSVAVGLRAARSY